MRAQDGANFRGGLMRFTYPIPKTDDDFEHLCCQVLKRHWNRPGLQRYAHAGEGQDGVDIHDPLQTKPIHGAQCKLHDYGKTIPPAEIQGEVDKAKSHVPPLEHYAILTTGRKSKQADKKVAEINQLHREHGLFTVEVLTWDQIEVLLDQYPDVRDPIYNTVGGQTVARFTQQLATLQASVEASTQPADALDGELDAIKVEIERYELKVAQRLSERLEERHGDKLSPRQRWRLLSLQANVLLSEGESERAGRLLLQAKQQQPLEEKAQVNEALGYELTGDIEKAHALALSLRQAFPDSSSAAAIWVRTAPASLGSSELEADVASFADKESDVALSLSICSLNRGDVERAERYALRATELQPELAQTWLMLGQSIHTRACKQTRADQLRQLLRQAEAHYSRTIDLAHAHGNVHIEAAAFLNRAVAREVLADTNAAVDFRTARQLAPQDASVMRKHALYLANQNQMDQAVTEAIAASAAEPGNESSVLLAALLWDRNQGDDRRQSLDLCLRAASGAETHRFSEALEMAVLGLSEFKRWDDVTRLLGSLPQGRISEVARSTLLSQLNLAQTDRVSAESLARTAHAAVGDQTSTQDLRRLARLLGRLGLFNLALPLLQRIAQPGRFDADSQMLLDCANHLHNHHVVLDVCRQLREAGVEDPRLLNNELDILQLYDRPTAIEVLQTHLGRNPNDRLARLRLSLLALQSERHDLVITDVNRLPPVDEAPPGTIGRAVLSLLMRTGRWLDALRYAYALLRRNLSDPEAHLLYCNLILTGEQQGWPVNSSETVQPGMAIAYREKGDSRDQWAIIEDEEQDLLPDELPPTHLRAQRMMATKPGDTFSLSAVGIQARTAEVVSILSKYVYRFRESMNQFQVRFPDRPELQQVRLTREGSEPDEQPDLAPIFASLDRRREHVSQALITYRERPTPVHLFATAVGRNIFAALDSLSTIPDAGVRWCCLGTIEEREEALRAWKDNISTVLDLTALFTICRLDITEVLRRWKSRHFVVSQTTFDKLRDIVEAESQAGPRRQMATDEQGRHVFSEVPEEALRPYIEAHHRLGAFVHDCCSVRSTPELASMEPEHRDQMIELFDRDGLESMVLASRDGHVLWTDDLTLAQIARQDSEAPRRAWTQVALQAAVDEGLLQQDDFNRCSAHLIGGGYSFTWCNSAIVLRAGSIASWNCEAWPLRQVIRYFRLDSVHPQVRLQIAAQSIVGMFKAVSSSFPRQAFILAVLNQLGSRRLALALAEALDSLFGVDVMSAQEALRVVHAWIRGPLFLP